MTTVAWDGKMLAADRQVTVNNSVVGNMSKVHRREDGALIALCGVAGTAAEFGRWFLAGEEGEAPSLKSATPDNSADILIIRPGKKLEWYDLDGWHYIETDRFAMGSGANLARMAMRCGKSAARAVELAAEFDIYTGPQVDVLHYDS